MYIPETFFTKQILEEVLENYKWPEKYDLISFASSVLIKFPNCSIYIVEGFESKMEAYFLNSETGRNDKQGSLSVFDAALVMKNKNLLKQKNKLDENLVRYLEVEPSLEKVKQGLNNICILLQLYLLPCIEGDFSWVEEYNKHYSGS